MGMLRQKTCPFCVVHLYEIMWLYKASKLICDVITKTFENVNTPVYTVYLIWIMKVCKYSYIDC